MLRSPRYDARPFVASIGIVAAAPASAASWARRDDRGEVAAAVERLARRARRREQRVEHRLLALGGLAERGDPAGRGLERRDERRRGRGMLAREAPRRRGGRPCRTTARTRRRRC